MAPEQVAPNGTYRFLKEEHDLVSLVDRYDNFLFGSEALPGVVSVLEKLRKLGKRILFVTNNASKSRRLLLERFEQLGIQASRNEVFSSAYASVLYLKNVLHFPPDRKVYVVGMAGLEEELDDADIQHLGGTVRARLTQDPQERTPLQGTDFSPLQAPGAMDHSVAAVLCGIDTQLTYNKMAKAFRYLTRENATCDVKSGEAGGGCYFLCTNDDTTFPTKEGPWPGAGSVWSGIRDASKRSPTVIGKPNQPMIDTIFASEPFDRSRTLMIGDRLNTDIAFGQNGGVDTMLVLTGISSEEDVRSKDAPAVPTYVVQGLGALDVLTP